MKIFLLFALLIAGNLAQELITVENYNNFTTDIYKELRGINKHNFVVSPYSVQILLAFADMGAAGLTAEQLSKALHFPNDKLAIQRTFHYITPYLKGNDKYTLNSATKMYVKEGSQINELFSSIAQDSFRAAIEPISFENPEKAAAKINDWVTKATDNQIGNLVDKTEFDNYTRSVLINAVNFHGRWVHSFKKSVTQKRNFTLNDGEQVEVDMMQQATRINYYASEELGAEFLELPYDGDEASMTFVLPNANNRLENLEERLGEVLVKPAYVNRIVEAYIPKFTISTSTKFKEIMQRLGVIEAFEDNANFSGIFKNENLKIDNIFQKAHIEVTEAGVKASAGSSVNLVLPRSPLFKIATFTANRPFIYYITVRDVVLFVGRYNGPEKLN